MRKPLDEFAKYLKGLVQEIPQSYEISPIYAGIADRAGIQEGVLAFRDFVLQFLDYIIAAAHEHDNPKNISEREEHNTNLTMDYPFLKNMSTVLLCMGICGELGKSGDALALDGGRLNAALKEAKVTNAGVYLRYLTECGIHFNGIDLDKDKPTIKKGALIEASYPDSPVMLVGLRVMAKAQAEINPKRTDNIFLRCDYKVLGGSTFTPATLLADVMKGFPAETQSMMLNFHKRILDKGFVCKAENDRQGVGYFFVYANKSKATIPLWIIKVTSDTCAIKIDAKHALKYADVLEKFPTELLELITNGDDGCICEPTPEKCKVESTGFKFLVKGTRHYKCSSRSCSGACFWVPVTGLTKEKGKAIEQWVDLELSYVK